VASASLPRYSADAWAGGFTVASPTNTVSISAATGTVVAATECIYLLRPGATRFHSRDNPPGAGDAISVAVEPRRPGRPQRFAVATMDSLHVYDGEGVASVKMPEDHGEIVQILWGPDVQHESPTNVLYVRCENVLLTLVPGGGQFGTFVQLGDTLATARALATDHAGGFAYACFDEEHGDVDVWFLAELKPQLWYRRTLDAPDFFDMQLAIAGKSIAASFDDGSVWMTRDCKEHPFTEVEPMRGRLDPVECGGAPAIAFEGTANDAALFAAVQDSKTTQHIVRVDAEGRATRIAEVEIETNNAEHTILPPVRALAWDATRRTLWGAAGRAGIICSTAPGAPSPMGAKAAS
jgi:hypothetical protein